MSLFLLTCPDCGTPHSRTWDRTTDQKLINWAKRHHWKIPCYPCGMARKKAGYPSAGPIPTSTTTTSPQDDLGFIEGVERADHLPPLVHHYDIDVIRDLARGVRARYVDRLIGRLKAAGLQPTVLTEARGAIIQRVSAETDCIWWLQQREWLEDPTHTIFDEPPDEFRFADLDGTTVAGRFPRNPETSTGATDDTETSDAQAA